MTRRKKKMTDNHSNQTALLDSEGASEEINTPEKEEPIKTEIVGESNVDENDVNGNNPDTTSEIVLETTSDCRRLIIIDGGKGGVGKSMWTRGIVQAYIDKKTDFIAFDADNSNPDLLKYYGKHCRIQHLNIFKDGSIDKFFDQMKKMIYPELDEYNQKLPSESLFLLELPPQSRQIFKKFITQMEFLEIAKSDYNMKVTMVVVISRVSDSVQQLIDLYSFCGSNVDYIVVKNLFFGEEDEFTRYDNSSEVKKIKQELAKKNSPFFDITMSELIEHAYDYLDEHAYTFNQGIEQRDLPSVKGRVRNWVKTFKEQIEPVKHLLGLETLNNI
jgi:hypothetical protein